MTLPTRPLTAVDTPALDALLADWGLPGSYARSHLRAQGLQDGGVRAVGCLPAGAPETAAPDAALVGYDGIGWAVWREPEQARALARALPGLGLNLLSGPRPLVEPLVAHLMRPAVGGADKCPFERVTPG